MKPYLSILMLLVILSCTEREGPEIITLADPVYVTESNLSSPPQFRDPFTKEELDNKLKSEFNSIMKEDSSITVYSFEALLYLNAKGTVDKIAVISAPDKRLTSIFVDYMKDKDMIPGKLAGRDTSSILKFSYDFTDYKDDLEYYLAADQMPEPKGGIAAIQTKIRYPEIAKRAGIQGRVFVKAFVDETGGVTKAEIIKGIGGGCDQAAMEAIVSTQFSPGIKDGEKVKVQVVIPVLFRLQ